MTFDRNFGRIGNWDTIDVFDRFSNSFEFLNLTWLDLNFFVTKSHLRSREIIEVIQGHFLKYYLFDFSIIVLVAVL